MVLSEHKKIRIQTLKKEGNSIRRIAAKTNTSPTTVDKYLKSLQPSVSFPQIDITPNTEKLPIPSVVSLSITMDQNRNYLPLPPVPVYTPPINILMLYNMMKTFDECSKLNIENQKIIDEIERFRIQRKQEYEKKIKEDSEKIEQIKQSQKDHRRQRKIKLLERRVDRLAEYYQQKLKQTMEFEAKQQNDVQKSKDTQEHRKEPNNPPALNPDYQSMNKNTIDEEHESSEKQSMTPAETILEPNNTGQTVESTTDASMSYEDNDKLYCLVKSALEVGKVIINFSQNEQNNVTPASTNEQSTDIYNPKNLPFLIPLDENKSQIDTTSKTNKKRGGDDIIWA